MKNETKKARLAEMLGISLPDPVEGPKVSREAEAVLAYVEKPSDFRTKNCKICLERFSHSYGAVAYCSDRCRAKALAEIGISWNPDKKPEERWEFQEPPLVVPKEAQKVLDSLGVGNLT